MVCAARLNDILETLEAETSSLGFDMASDREVGALLRSLVASKPRGRFLELGTGTGLSTAWLLAGMDKFARLVSVDNDKVVQRVAATVLGSDPRLKLVCEDGGQYIQAQKSESFDFIFADAWPGKFSYLKEVLALIKPGGLYVVDDLLPQTNWPEGHEASVASFKNYMRSSKVFHCVDMAWASGVLIATKFKN